MNTPSTNSAARGSRVVSILFGGLLLCFYALHAVYHIEDGHPEHLLWTCNLAVPSVGLALILRSPLLNGMGMLLLCIGVPLWLLDACLSGRFLPTSILTHFGGLACGFYGLQVFGLPPRSWWAAMCSTTVLVLATRLITPADANVNLSFTVRHWFGFELPAISHVAFLLALWALVLTAAAPVLRKVSYQDQEA